MAKRCIIAGNWKMNGLTAHVKTLAAPVAAHVSNVMMPGLQVVLCPPATLIHEIVAIGRDKVSAGGQDCHMEETGAFTGNISAMMLKDAGARYVIVGHSERRQYHAESSELVAKKASAALKAGLTPIICIGETLEEREGGKTETVLAEQIAQSIPADATAENAVIAYEPVWAIGTGKVATAEQVRDTHAFIAGKLPQPMPILYGGSVKPDNAREILGISHVYGVLVGGASLKFEDFNAIIDAGVLQLKG
jgi:triosephosphate isomerase (TIM)